MNCNKKVYNYLNSKPMSIPYPLGNVAGEWMDLGDFTAYWSGDNSGLVGHTAFDCYQTELAANWSGSGDYDYTSGGDTFHIFDIVINPSVEDSLFAYS